MRTYTRVSVVVLFFVLFGIVRCAGPVSNVEHAEVGQVTATVKVATDNATIVTKATATSPPSATPRPTQTPTATATATATPTRTPSPTATATSTATPTSTVTPSPTATPTPLPTNTPWPTWTATTVATAEPTTELTWTPEPMPTATIVAAGGSTVPFGTYPETIEALVACLAPIYRFEGYTVEEWSDENGVMWQYQWGNVASVDPVQGSITFVGGPTETYNPPGVFLRYQRERINWWNISDNWQLVPQLFTWENILSAIQIALSQGKVVGIHRVVATGYTNIICHSH